MMNAVMQPNTLNQPKLRVGDFQLLRESGAFAGYFKSELLDGELWVGN